jgi:two-component system response regulator (stage 0 sporulation protein F)
MDEKRILFVDDEIYILKTLNIVFKKLGYEPFITSSGEEALELVGLEKVRVCFLDLRMPEIDGMELCRRIKRVAPDARVYALSAYVDAFTPAEFSDAGFVGAFRKPFNFEELQDAADRALASSARAAGGAAADTAE